MADHPRTLFFCIGAEKAATSWLDDYLAGHPEVATPEFKEVNYWNTVRVPRVKWARQAFAERHAPKLGAVRAAASRVLGGRPARRAEARRRLARLWAGDGSSHDAYLEVLMQNAGGREVAGEVCPGYADLGAETFAEMAALGPDVRFLCLMRDPVARAISSARMHILLGRTRGYAGTDTEGFLDYLLAEAPRHSPLRFSRYEVPLSRLEEGVPGARLHCTFYETLFREGQAEIDRLTAFLGVGPWPGRFGRVKNPAKTASAGIGAAMTDRLRAEFDGTYSFIRARFGDTCPDDWLW